MDENRIAAADLVQFFALDSRDLMGDLTLRHRVASQLLGPIQHFLPQCHVFDAAGQLCVTRQPLPPIARTVVPLPQHLLLINWADSAPGVSWPEDYYCTYVPEHGDAPLCKYAPVSHQFAGGEARILWTQPGLC